MVFGVLEKAIGNHASGNTRCGLVVIGASALDQLTSAFSVEKDVSEEQLRVSVFCGKPAFWRQF